MNIATARVADVVATGGLPIHVMLILACGVGILAALVYTGIALPAVWSANPERRKAAAEVLGQILAFFRRR